MIRTLLIVAATILFVSGVLVIFATLLAAVGVGL